MMAKIQVLMPGSCGELVQGSLNGVNLHITCPVNKHSRVMITRLKNSETKIQKDRGETSKTLRAVKKTLELLETTDGVEVDIKSDLPEGKGMASSTADIVAAVSGILKLFQRNIQDQEIADIALFVEPTDGILFEGIVAFDHLNGRYFESIGDAPPLDIVVLEPPEKLDTIAFNKERRKIDELDERLFNEAFDMAVEGIRSNDVRIIGEAATLSAILNQKVLFKPELEDVVDICKRNGGVGVNIAHSGTVMGMIVERSFGKALLEKVSHYIPKHWNAYVVSMVSGGPVFDVILRRSETEPKNLNYIF